MKVLRHGTRTEGNLNLSSANAIKRSSFSFSKTTEGAAGGRIRSAMEETKNILKNPALLKVSFSKSSLALLVEVILGLCSRFLCFRFLMDLLLGNLYKVVPLHASNKDFSQRLMIVLQQKSH